MSVLNTSYKDSYVGRGDTGPYAITFDVVLDDGGNATDVVVKLIDPAGTETDITSTSTFTGLNVYTASSWDATYTVVLIRYPALTQPYAFPYGTKFPSRTFESALDRLLFTVQRLSLESDQSLKVPLSEVAPGRLPTIADRANTLLGFDADGDPIPASGTAAPVTPFMATVLDDTDADTARDTLYVGIEKYSAAKTYSVNALVSYSGEIYKALQAGTGNTPSYGSAYWYPYSKGLISDLTSDDTAAIGNVIVKSASGYQISKANGTIQTFSVGTAVSRPRVIMLTTALFVFVYDDATNWKIVAATLSGNTLTFGSAVTLCTRYSSNMALLERVSDTHFVASAHDGSGYLTAVCGSVSGTTITLGSTVQPNGASATGLHGCHQAVLDATHVMWVFPDAGTSYYMTGIIATITGTTLALGSKYVLTGNPIGNTKTIRVVSYSSGKIMAFYSRSTGGGRCMSGTWSGTVITWGSEVSWGPDATSDWQLEKVAHLGSGVWVAAAENGNLSVETGVIETDAITPVGDISKAINWYTPAVHTRFNIVKVSDRLAMVLLNVPGSSSLSSPTICYVVEVDPNEPFRFTVSEGHVLIMEAADQSDAIAITETSLLFAYILTAATTLKATVVTLPFVVGVAQSAGTSIKVAVSGYASGLTGLTIGKEYYLGLDGVLTTDAWWSGARVGKAISTTEIMR